MSPSRHSSPKDPLARARQLHTRAVDAYASARPRSALKLSHRALTLVDGDEPATVELRVRINVTLALSMFELAGPTESLRVLAETERYAERSTDPSLRLLVRGQRGAVAIRSGDFRLAALESARALELRRHASAYEQCVILANAGTAHLHLGELGPARERLRDAVEVAVAAGLEREEGMWRHNLGYVEFLAGDLPRALAEMDHARALTTEMPEGIPLLDRARVLAEAGLSREAEVCLASAGEVFRRDRLMQDLAETELERARVALLGGDVKAARRLAGKARDRFRRRDNPPWRRTAELVLLQADLAAGRPGGRLVAPSLRLRAEFAAEGLRLSARTAAFIAAEAHASAGDAAAAAELMSTVGVPKRTDPLTARLHDAYVRALIEPKASAARRRITRALDELTDYQAGFGSIDMRTAAAVHGRKLAELDLALALRDGRPRVVFAAAERARAATSRMPAVRPPDDPVAADLLAELRQTLEALRATDFDRVASAPLQRRRTALEGRIAARTWTTAGDGGATRPVREDRVRSELATRQRTMITYVQSRGRLLAVVLGSALTLRDLGRAAEVVEQVRRVRADLDVLASPWLPAPMRSAVQASLERSLDSLDGALIAPVRVDGPLVVVSTGVLGQLPWASLRSLRGVPVEVAPSATKWVASSSVPASGRPRAVALAGPDLGRGVDEAEAIGRVWADARTVAGATRTDLVAALGDADVLHIAAHGVHQPENPLFSSLRMVDGPVFAHELSGTAPEHVVLSACEVGLATIRPGDEALGLASVLLHLGARSVVASVARVNDDQAARVMVAYHALLADGLDSAAALARALAEDDSDVVAPFVTFGAGWGAAGGLARARPVA